MLVMKYKSLIRDACRKMNMISGICFEILKSKKEEWRGNLKIGKLLMIVRLVYRSSLYHALPLCMLKHFYTKSSKRKFF